MKVALITPPAIGNQVRGTGVYVRRLIAELIKIQDLEIEQLTFNFWKWDYSKFDLVHFLYFDPFFLTLPPFRNTKTIISVMDLTTIVLNDMYPRGLRGEIKWQSQKYLLNKADHIITISNSAKQDIARILNYPSDKISVTYLAPSEVLPTTGKSLRSIVGATRGSPAQEVKNKFNLPEKFGLYVGDIDPNKNLINLIETLPHVANQDFKLVLVGKSLKEDIPEALAIRKKIEELNLKNRVIITGFVEDADLVAIYSLATMFIHPAIYEGFGLGVLQALSMGLPTICGNNSSLPEVVGGAALFADVSNPNDLAQKISQILKLSSKEREFIRQKSLNQAKKFSWEKTAKETAAVYENLKKNK